MHYTSSPVIVRADTPVSDCVRIMREANIGSVLVVSDDAEENLIGIFTERDLLKKVELIQKGDHWNNPVRTVMSSPVWTLDVSKIQLAAKIMLQHHFRHMPIVARDSNNRDRIVGVVSMRDLFQNLILQQEKKAIADTINAKKSQGKMRIHLMTKHDFFANFIMRVFHAVLEIPVKRITDFDIGKKTTTVIFDIDGFEQEVWPNRLQDLNHHPLVRLIIVAYNPTLHAPELVQVIEKLSHSSKFLIFRKPLEVFELLNRLAT